MFSADRQTAADEYERVRIKLTKFFSWQRCPFPEECADETLNRVAKRLAEGEDIQKPGSYFYGVARMVLKETQADLERKNRAVLELGQANWTTPAVEDMETSECLRACLSALPREQRQFILKYYSGDQRKRVDNRQAMADELQIPMNALRNRALRLRDKIHNCVGKRLRSKQSA